MIDKVLGGAAKFTDKTRKGIFTRASKGITEMEFVPRVFNKKGAFLVSGLAVGGMLLSDMHKGYGASKVGRATYADGMSKMTSSFTTGAVPAMMRASHGDYEVFSEMASNVVRSNGFLARQIDDCGANPEMIRALYNMR